MEQRHKLDAKGRKMGKRHKICAACSKANRIQMDDYRKRVYLHGGRSLMVPSAGTRRRLQALQAMGWNFREVGKKIGADSSALSNIASVSNINVYRVKMKVYPETAEKVTAVYDEMAMIPPPDDWLHRRTATMARDRGYLPPLCWDDELIDDPYGLPTGLTHLQEYRWFWLVATHIERIEYVLEHGLGVTRKKC